MKVFNKKAFIKWFFVALFISLAIFVVSTIAYGSNAEGDYELEASKSVKWIEPGDYSKGMIELEAKVKGKTQTTPDVLFIGTMCSAHGLTNETIAKALNAITTTSNVDYFLFNNENPQRQSKDKSGKLSIGEKVQASDFVIDTTRNHQALGKFFKCIYEQHLNHVTKTGKGYDFVVLEFDGTRISDWYRHLSPLDEPSPPGTPDGEYKKYSNEVETVNILKNYYSNNQVIWITDKDWTPGVERSGYWPKTDMNVRTYDVHTRKINYNSLLGFLAPDLYKDTGDSPDATQAEIEAIDAAMDDPTGVTDPVPEQYVLKNNRQVGYANSNKVGDFLEEQIHGLYTYTLKINDYVDIADNIKFSASDVKLYEKKNVGDAWQPYTKTFTPTIDTTTGQVYIEIPNLEGDEYFKVEITFEDKSASEKFIEKSIDGIPNFGPVEEEVVPNAGDPTSDEATIDDPEETLDWPVQIHYKVEDQYIGKGPSVTSEKDENINSVPTDGHKPAGSTAQIGTSKYSFTYWTLGESGDEVSTTSNFVPTTKTDGFDNGRYHEVTYVAHFKENPEPSTDAIITYHVQGAEIVGELNPVTPSDSITPSEESVAQGTRNYVLKGATPTTKWTTSDGTVDGVPGTWTFYNLGGDVWFTDQTYTTKISPIAEINQPSYQAYGKWVFTPEQPQPTPSIDIKKAATLAGGGQIAKPGDTITYKIAVKNGDFDLTNLIITDEVDKLLSVSGISDSGIIDENNVITWTFDAFAANASKTLTFNAKIPLTLEKETSIKNVAKVSSDEVEEKLSNVTETIVVPEFAPSIDKVEKIAMLENESEVAKPGDVINYYIMVTNGDVAVTKLNITDAVNQILVVSDISDNGTIDENNVITWTFDTFASSESKIVSFKATIPKTITEDMLITNVGKARATDTLEKASNVVETKLSQDTPTPTPDPGNVTPPSFSATQTGDAICILGLALVVVFGAGFMISTLERRRKDR